MHKIAHRKCRIYLCLDDFFRQLCRRCVRLFPAARRCFVSANFLMCTRVLAAPKMEFPRCSEAIQPLLLWLPLSAFMSHSTCSRWVAHVIAMHSMQQPTFIQNTMQPLINTQYIYSTKNNKNKIINCNTYGTANVLCVWVYALSASCERVSAWLLYSAFRQYAHMRSLLELTLFFIGIFDPHMHTYTRTRMQRKWASRNVALVFQESFHTSRCCRNERTPPFIWDTCSESEREREKETPKSNTSYIINFKRNLIAVNES